MILFFIRLEIFFFCSVSRLLHSTTNTIIYATFKNGLIRLHAFNSFPVTYFKLFNLCLKKSSHAFSCFNFFHPIYFSLTRKLLYVTHVRPLYIIRWWFLAFHLDFIFGFSIFAWLVEI